MVLKKPYELNQNFYFLNEDSSSVNLKNLLKNYNLIYFGYTNCPDVCYTALRDISESLKYIKNKNVNVIFISLDLKRDKPSVIKRYLKNFNGNFIGLVPIDENELYKVSKFFSIGYEYYDNGYIGHSSFIILMKNYKVVEIFPIGIEPKYIADDIKKW